MRMPRAPLLAAVFALSTLDGVAEEKQIADVKELAGSWRGWVTEVAGDEWATMNVSNDGSYEASTISVATVGRFYFQAGKLSVSLETNDAFGHAIWRGARDRERFRRQRQDRSHVDA
jgi:hypothetical protein